MRKLSCKQIQLNSSSISTHQCDRYLTQLFEINENFSFSGNYQRYKKMESAKEIKRSVEELTGTEGN